MAVDLMKLPKVTNVKHTIEPVWASDTGRNSNSGSFSGTFVGWFDNLEIKVGKTTPTELQQIREAIEIPIIENVSFYDTKKNKTKVEDFYGTAIGVEINKKTIIYPPFSFSLKATVRRGDM